MLKNIADKLYLVIVLSFAAMISLYIPFADGMAYRVTITMLPLGTILMILFNGRRCLEDIKRRKDSWIYILFCTAYGVTVLINREYNLVQNCKALMWLVIYFFLVYMWQEKDAKDYMRKTIIINRVIIVLNFFLVLAGDLTLLLNLNFSAQYGGVPLGVDTGRLFGVYLELNSGCILTLCSVLSSYVNIYLEKLLGKTVAWHWLYAVNAILSYVFLFAAKSRTSMICLCVSCAIIACSYVYKRLFFAKPFKRALVYILVAALTFGGTSGFNWLMEKGISEGVKLINILRSGDGSAGIVLLEREDQSKSFQVRVDIWKQSISLWKETNPLFGIGQANMRAYAEMSENTEDYSSLKSGKYGEATHNVLVSVLLASGAVGLLLILVLWGGLLGKSAMYFLKGQHLQNQYLRNTFTGVLCIVVSLLLYGLMFTAIVFSNIFETLFFWWYFGLLGRMVNGGGLEKLSGDGLKNDN